MDSHTPMVRCKRDHTTHMSHPAGSIDPLLLLVVFTGGTIGSAMRFALETIEPIGPASSVHVGTLTANVIACFFYSGIAVFLAAFSKSGLRQQEIWNRGLCMGMCGGLSTLSALMLEVFLSLRSGATLWAIIYLLMTFVCGIASAAAGSWLGALLSRSLAKRSR